MVDEFTLIWNQQISDYTNNRGERDVLLKYFILLSVPNQVTDLTESGASTTSVTATWTKPDGVVDGYLVSCSAGMTPDYIEPEDGGSPYTATCSGLPTAGDTYTITVTSRSDGKSGAPVSVTIRACELIYPSD